MKQQQQELSAEQAKINADLAQRQAKGKIKLRNAAAAAIIMQADARKKADAMLSTAQKIVGEASLTEKHAERKAAEILATAKRRAAAKSRAAAKASNSALVESLMTRINKLNPRVAARPRVRSGRVRQAQRAANREAQQLQHETLEAELAASHVRRARRAADREARRLKQESATLQAQANRDSEKKLATVVEPAKLAQTNFQQEQPSLTLTLPHPGQHT